MVMLIVRVLLISALVSVLGLFGAWYWKIFRQGFTPDTLGEACLATLIACIVGATLVAFIAEALD